jgi:diadenosine tetraphosphate (Ap4A) HIT family hydrolase
MITKSKVILSTTDQRMLETLAKFEAIKVISDKNEAERIWSLNKTPIIFGHGGDITVPKISEHDFERKFTQWAYEMGFEPGEHVTGKKFNSAKDACVLCGIARYGGLTDNSFTHNATVQKEVDVILYESPNFYVTSELGALKKGFLMIVPKRHILSIAQLPSELYPEYEEVCEDVEQLLVRTFGDARVAYFEHGSGPSGYTSHPKSIVHAHVHVLWNWILEQRYLDMISARPIDSIKMAATTHYFAYKSGSKGQCFCCYDDDVYVPRQFSRQIIAEELGFAPGLYNWRRYDFSENVHMTLYYIWRMLKTEANLSDRIRTRTECFRVGYAKRDQ